jgi:hypothetical protein
MIRTQDKVTCHMQVELNLAMWIATIVCLVAGIGMCLGYLVVAKFNEEMPEYAFYLLLGVFPLLIGLGLVAVVSKNLSLAKKSKVENFYAFTETQVMIKTVTADKETGTFSYPYAHFKKISNTPCFIFLYPQSGGAFGVDKRKLSKDQVITLKKWLKLTK